jgi:hypothetical protein
LASLAMAGCLRFWNPVRSQTVLMSGEGGAG